MIEYLLKKRKITLLFFVMVIITGFLSFLQLPRQQEPDVIINQATVTTIYPGAPAEKVEQTVTKKIEQRIKELQGVKNITSSSGSGYSFILVEAEDGVDPKKEWDELRKKVQDAESDLPDEAEKPVVNDDLNRQAFYTLHLTADSQDQLYSLRETVKSWKDRLRTVPGVADVTVGGLPEQEARVEVDTRRLAQYGITWTQVVEALKSENEKTPTGDLSIKGRIYQLKLPDTYRLEDLNRVIVTRSAGGFPVYLQDVGRAYLATEKVKTYVYHNGRPAIVMGVIVEKGTDIPSLQASVDKMLPALQKSLPVWAEVEPVYSSNREISALFGDLKREMLIAMGAVLFICTLGLNFIAALMVAIAIPISMAVGLLFLPPLGITLNNITMYSLIMVLGILVDDAVVVNDNIERRLFMLRESPLAASVNGAREVSLSILTATMATLFSFGPLLLLKGDIGQFIRPIPTVIIFTMLASMAMSLTIIPIFRRWYERGRYQDKAFDRKPAGLLGRRLKQLTGWYANKLMPRMLRHPLRTGLTGVLIGTLAYGLIPFIPVELFPDKIREELPLLITLPKGSDVEETRRIAVEVQGWVSGQPGVKEVEASAGARAGLWFGQGEGLTDVADENAMVMARLDTKKVKLEEAADRWGKELRQKYPGVDFNPLIIKEGPPVGDPITLHIYGDDIGELRQLSQQVRDRISRVPGASNIQDNFGMDRYSLEFQVNKAMMEQRLVSYSELSRTLRLVSEGITVSQFDTGKDLIDIKLYAEKSGGDPVAVFQHLTVASAAGEQIPLSEIATVRPSFAIQAIPHRNLARVVTITGDVQGRTATEVMNDVKQIMGEMELPDGYRWEVGGETSEQTDIFIDLGKLSIVVFFLILIQIAMQFYSISIPFLVMSTVYLAVAGSMIGLFITRTPLGFMSMLGCISLAGIVVRNGIVLIDFIEKARRAGSELGQAVIQAGEARLRPILMTSLTAMAGLMPMALSGSSLFRPLAITIISGLLLSTMLTLIVVPSLYTALAAHKERRKAGKALK